MSDMIKGKIAKVIDKDRLVINKGEFDGITSSQKILVYFNDEEIFDPDTNESLGCLEIICGLGKAEHIQPKMATIISDKFTQREIPVGLFGNATKTEYVPVPFLHIDQENLLFKVIK